MGGITIVPKTLITGTDDATKQVSKDVWNAGHEYSVDYTGTYDVPLMSLIVADAVIWTDDIVQTTDESLTDMRTFNRMTPLDGVSVGVAGAMVRAKDVSGNYDRYYNTMQPDPSSADYSLYKQVTGSNTLLGSESVNLTVGVTYATAVQASSTTIGAYRGNGNTVDGTAKVEVTDSALSSGGHAWDNGHRVWVEALQTNNYTFSKFESGRAQSSSSPHPTILSSYLDSVIGDGSHENPFRARTLEGQKITYGALIKTGNDGKPTNNEALISVYKANSTDILNQKCKKVGNHTREQKRLDELL